LTRNEVIIFGLIGVEGNREREYPVNKIMKQYLVVKVANKLGAMMELIPVAGLFPLDAAERFVKDSVAHDPESLFLIQQVGTA
jgi:hypothetical protein